MPPRDGQVALVIGARSGIGLATALRLAADGAAVGCLGLGEEALAPVAEEIRAAGGLAIPLAADVTDRAAVEAVAPSASPNGGTVFPG